MLVGRARELSQLCAALARAARDDGVVVALAGEAGVGKSHLLSAFLDVARERGFEVLLGRCFADTGHQAFAPWREALGDLSLTGGVGPRVELGAREDRARSFETVLLAIRTRADARPLALAIEDLHWADPDSLRLFLHVARFALRSAIVLLGSVRTPDLDAARNDTLEEVLAELSRESRCEQVRLRSFGEEEVREYAGAVAGGEVPQAVARAER